MNPKGNLFYLFQSERKRLKNEIDNGILESIFYNDKKNSIQYKINDIEKGVLTILLLCRTLQR